jgi:phosphotransferase system HPr-like phosphotransfer protein
MLDLLSLGACNGTVLTLEANGEDAEEASRAIEGLFDNRFNEDDESVVYTA